MFPQRQGLRLYLVEIVPTEIKGKSHTFAVQFVPGMRLIVFDSPDV